jgi:hypothetical protein
LRSARAASYPHGVGRPARTWIVALGLIGATGLVLIASHPSVSEGGEVPGAASLTSRLERSNAMAVLISIEPMARADGERLHRGDLLAHADPVSVDAELSDHGVPWLPLGEGPGGFVQLEPAPRAPPLTLAR